jgi:hypothetical protein
MLHRIELKGTTRALRGLGVAALLAGIIGVAYPTAPRAHAGAIGTPTGGICIWCYFPRPSITASATADGSGNIAVSGSDFTAGGTVHVEIQANAYDTLLPPPTPQPGQTLPPPAPVTAAATNTTATVPLTLPLGTGQYVTIPGGKIAVTLTPQEVRCGDRYLTVVATDLASGRTASVINVRDTLPC